MAGVPVLVPALFAANGLSPASGAKLYAYIKGTVTPQAIYTDDGLVTPAANPTIANSLGATVRYLDPAKAYDLVAKTSDDATTLFSVTYNVDANNIDLGSGWEAEIEKSNDWQTIASAATVDLSAATSNKIIISGTTTITSFGTVASGTRFLIRFSSACQVTYNATSMIMPRAANMVFSAGDAIEVVSSGSGNWRVFPLSNATVQNGTLANPIGVDPAFGYTLNYFVTYGNPGVGSADAFTTTLVSDSHLSAGSRGIAIGALFRGYCDGTWTTGGSTEAGAIGLQSEATTTRGGTLFGASVAVTAATTAGARTRGLELDFFNTANVESKIGVLVVSPNTDTGTITGTVTVNGGNTVVDGAAYDVVAIGGGSGFPYAFKTIKSSGGVQPIAATGSLWRAGGFAIVYGLDWLDMDFTGSAIRGPNNKVLLSARNAANSADVEVAKVDSTNRVSLAGGAILVNPTTGGITTPNRSYASIDMNGATQAIPVSAATVVSFARALTNVGSHFNTTNYRYTPPLGNYVFCFAMFFTTNVAVGDDFTISLRQNGATLRQITFIASEASQLPVAGTIEFVQSTASDYWDVIVTITPGSGALDRTLISSTANTWAVFRQV